MTRKLIHIFSGMTLVLISFIIAMDLISGSTMSEKNLYYVILVGVINIYAYLVTKNDYKYGFHFVILTYTILCQFGFLFAYNWNPDVAVFRSNASMAFMSMPQYPKALEISWIFIAALAMTVRYSHLSVVFGKKKYYFEADEYDSESSDQSFEKASFIVGMLLLLLGVSLLFIAFLRTRGVVYSERVLILNELSWYGHVIVILSFAFALVLANCNDKQWKIALVPYLLVIALHFLMGNRGEVLYSLITCVAIYHMRYKKINKKMLLIGGIALIMIVPLVRDFRTTMSIDNYTSNVSTNIVETFSEIGYQIAPFTYTIEIVESGVPYRLGATYLYGIGDFIGRKIPFIGGLPTASLNNVKYMMPRKGMGYSQVAEGFYNFGIIGGAIFFVFIGFMIFQLEKIYINPNESKYKRTFSALFVVELINITRNSAGTLMLYISYIAVILLLIWIVRKTCWR